MSMSARKARTRRRDRQIDNKRARQKERRALDGAVPEVMRSRGTWAPTAGQPPLVSEELPHRAKRDKRHVKERCPVNGTHEWYREWIEERGYDIEHQPGSWYRCEECRGCMNDHWPRQNIPDHDKFVHYTASHRVDTCIHCWKVRETRPHRVYDNGKRAHHTHHRWRKYWGKYR